MNIKYIEETFVHLLTGEIQFIIKVLYNAFILINKRENKSVY